MLTINTFFNILYLTIIHLLIEFLIYNIINVLYDGDILVMFIISDVTLSRSLTIFSHILNPPTRV